MPDLPQGPEIRSGKLEGGVDVQLEAGSEFTLKYIADDPKGKKKTKLLINRMRERISLPVWRNNLVLDIVSRCDAVPENIICPCFTWHTTPGSLSVQLAGLENKGNSSWVCQDYANLSKVCYSGFAPMMFTFFSSCFQMKTES